jgi:hypothetical protein
MFECEELNDNEDYKCTRSGTSSLYKKFTYVVLKTGEKVYITDTVGEYSCWSGRIDKYQLFSDCDINHYKTMLCRVEEYENELRDKNALIAELKKGNPEYSEFFEDEEE